MGAPCDLLRKETNRAAERKEARMKIEYRGVTLI